MKQNPSNLQSSEDSELNQEPWVPKNEIMKKYNVSERKLTYWRGKGKISYQNIRNRTFYKESEVHAMVEKQNQPKKYLGIRKAYIIRKLKNIDPVLSAMVLGLLNAWAIGLNSNSNVFLFMLYNTAFSMIMIVGIIYYTIKLIKYTWRQLFRKRKD